MKLLRISFSCASLFVSLFLMIQTAPARAATTVEQEATGTIRELQGRASALALKPIKLRIPVSFSSLLKTPKTSGTKWRFAAVLTFCEFPRFRKRD